MDSIQIVEISSEIGAGTRGASLGTQAMKVASLNAKSDYFIDLPIIKVPDENHLLFQRTGAEEHTWAKRIGGLRKVYENLGNAVKSVLENNKFPLILAGDHSSAGGTIAGVKSAFPEKRLGVIWVDAHADLHSPFTTPSGNVHGMPLAISLGENNTDRTRNDVPQATITQWDALKNAMGISPKIQYEDLVFIGVRDTEFAEDYLIAKNNICKYSVTDVRIKGILKVVKEIDAYLEKCDMIYISFDVDSMDCQYVSKGTGTPVPVGFSEQEAKSLLNELLANEKVCCFEITEVNPTLDEKCNVMAETAFRVLEQTTATLKRRFA